MLFKNKIFRILQGKKKDKCIFTFIHVFYKVFYIFMIKSIFLLVGRKDKNLPGQKLEEFFFKNDTC